MGGALSLEEKHRVLIYHALGFSQDAIAEKLGRNRATIRRFETELQNAAGVDEDKPKRKRTPADVDLEKAQREIFDVFAAPLNEQRVLSWLNPFEQVFHLAYESFLGRDESDNIVSREEMYEQIPVFDDEAERIDYTATAGTSVSDEIQDALTHVAAQFYHSNLAHLTLCLRIAEQQRSPEPLEPIIALFPCKFRNMIDFGNYIRQYQRTTDALPPLEASAQESMNRMLAEHEYGSQLLRMGTIGGTLGYSVLESLSETEDPTFNELAETVAKQKRTNEVNWLIPAITSTIEWGGQEYKRDMLEKARDLKREVIEIVESDRHEEVFAVLDIETREVAATVEENTDKFYRRVGLRQSGAD